MDKYILDNDGNPIPCDDIFIWGEWYENNFEARIVARYEIGDVCVSTVFLALDHSFGDGPPLLYETMVFGLPEEHCERTSTKQQAIKCHERYVYMVIQLAEDSTLASPRQTS